MRFYGLDYHCRAAFKVDALYLYIRGTCELNVVEKNIKGTKSAQTDIFYNKTARFLRLEEEQDLFKKQ